MSILTRWVFVGAVSASLASAAGAVTFSQLVVFGDSLSDAGNAAAITSNNFPPSPFPYAGPASNGPTAAQYLAQRYGATVELGWPSATASSNNYAVLGGLNGQGNYNVQIDQSSRPGRGLPHHGQHRHQPAGRQVPVGQSVGAQRRQHVVSLSGAGPTTLFWPWSHRALTWAPSTRPWDRR